MAIPVYLEVGERRVFASAADWPGWCLPGKGEEGALAALAGAIDRYRPVAEAAGLELPPAAEAEFQVVERIPGNATTDFGAPGLPARAESRPLGPGELKRQAALVAACWAALDAAAAGAPAELRKGPRGGGRDRDRILEHVYGAEASYVRKLGIKPAAPAVGDARALAAFRKEVQEALAGSDGAWPRRYLARRLGWHVLSHAWEIEDRLP